MYVIFFACMRVHTHGRPWFIVSSEGPDLTWSSLRKLQSVMVWMKKEFLCCSVFEWGTRKGLEFRVACLSVMFFEQ